MPRTNRKQRPVKIVPWLIGGGIALAVLFVLGIVVIVVLNAGRTPEPAPLPNAGPLIVTQPGGGVDLSPQAKAGFAQLRSGMNEQQVNALLGPATTRTYVKAVELHGTKFPPSVSLIFGRFGLNDHLTLELKDDKLTHANGMINGQRVHMSQ